MKKSLLALAVAFAATSVTAATVYDKDGTSLSVGGRVQSVLYNGKYNVAGDHDSGLVNSARLNLAGKTKINNYVSVFAFTEWNMADGHVASTGDRITARDQYIGADFGAYGKLIAGKTRDALYAVQSATDVFEDTACIANRTATDRRTGTFKYELDHNGFFASASFNTASDSALVAGSKSDVKYGYAASLGYTFDNVVFGPLSVKAGYSYLKGQNDEYVTGNTYYRNYFKDFKSSAYSVTWGNLNSGLYLAGLYNIIHFTYNPYYVDSARQPIYIPYGTFKTLDLAPCRKVQAKGFELVAGYAFDNGLNVVTGYEQVDLKYKEMTGVTQSRIEKRVPVLVNYQAAPTFKVWAEAEFDAGTNRAAQDTGIKRGTLLSVGGRYTF